MTARPAYTEARAEARREMRTGAGTFLRAWLADKIGNATIELALILPILITLGMYGTELAYMSMVNMEVSQLAMSVADNASRLGQTDNSSVTPTVSEREIDSVMDGALVQGSSIGIEKKGRIILSSLERQSSTGRQYIHWQRCRGDLGRTSAYGDAGTGLTGGFQGMGASGRLITANNNSAVMYAEVYYRYEGLFGDLFVSDVLFKQEAAFQIRDDRTLMEAHEPGVTGTGGKSSCS